MADQNPPNRAPALPVPQIVTPAADGGGVPLPAPQPQGQQEMLAPPAKNVQLNANTHADPGRQAQHDEH